MYIKTATLFFFLFLFIVAAAQIKPVKLKLTDLPKNLTYKGRVVDGLIWQDSSVKNFIVLTETGEFKSKNQKSEADCNGDCKDAELYAYRFLQTGDSLKQQWQLTDFSRTCPFDVMARFSKGSLTVTDLNKNNVAEIWLVYKTTCTSDVSPSTMKLFMYEGGMRYAVRGTSKVKVSETDTMGGEMKMDSNFTTGPKAFRDFAVKHWNKFVLDTYE